MMEAKKKMEVNEIFFLAFCYPTRKQLTKGKPYYE